MDKIKDRWLELGAEDWDSRIVPRRAPRHALRAEYSARSLLSVFCAEITAAFTLCDIGDNVEKDIRISSIISIMYSYTGT